MLVETMTSKLPVLWEQMIKSTSVRLRASALLGASDVALPDAHLRRTDTVSKSGRDTHALRLRDAMEKDLDVYLLISRYLFPTALYKTRPVYTRPISRGIWDQRDPLESLGTRVQLKRSHERYPPGTKREPIVNLVTGNGNGLR